MNTDYGPDRRFFRLFSAIKGYDGYLIGKLSCRRACQNLSDCGVRVRKQRTNFVMLELSEGKYLLTMTLVCPVSVSQQVDPDETKVRMQDTERKTVMPENVMARRSFTAAEILDFVQYVQDTNGIHRTADPVVPGLLMAEWFFSVLHSSDWRAVEMRFRMPVYAGQHLCLCRQSDRYDCLSEETGQLFWSGRLCCN